MDDFQRQLDRLIYIRNVNNTSSGDEDIDRILESGEPQKIIYDVNSEQTIWEFRVICRRLALSLGYSIKSAMDAFPHDTREDERFEDMIDGEIEKITPNINDLELKSNKNETLDDNWEDKINSEIKRIISEDEDDE